MYAFHQKGPLALDGVGPGLVGRFAAAHIGAENVFRPGMEADGAGIGKARAAPVGEKAADAGDDLMLAAGKAPQHVQGVRIVSGFAQDVVAQGHHGVGGQDQVVGPGIRRGGHGPRFGRSGTQGVGGGRFPVFGARFHPGGPDDGIGQAPFIHELAASRRGRSQHQPDAGPQEEKGLERGRVHRPA